MITIHQRNQIRKQYSAIMKRYEYIVLFRPAPGSPLGWRECLIFSAIIHLHRRKARISVRAIAEVTRLDRDGIPKSITTLQEHGLLDDHLAVKRPDNPPRYFAVNREPCEGDWIEGLSYGRYLRPVVKTNWRPIESSFLAVLMALVPFKTSISYLAAASGIDRKQVRTILKTFQELGLDIKRDNRQINLDYEEFCPEDTNFIRKPVSATKAKEHPAVLLEMVATGKIPQSYLDDLTSLHAKIGKHVFDADFRWIVDECVETHKTFEPKSGKKLPHPSLKYITAKLVGIYEKRKQIPTTA